MKIFRIDTNKVRNVGAFVRIDYDLLVILKLECKFCGTLDGGYTLNVPKKVLLDIAKDHYEHTIHKYTGTSITKIA